MRIHQDLEALASGRLHEGAKVGQVLAVVLPRSRVLHSLPGHHEPHEAETPGGKAAEVFLRLREGEGATHEGHVAPVVEALCFPRGAVGRNGHLAAPAEVHTAQEQDAPFVVPEPLALDLHVPGW